MPSSSDGSSVRCPIFCAASWSIETPLLLTVESLFSMVVQVRKPPPLT